MNKVEIRETLVERQQQLQQRLDAVQGDLQKSHSRDWSEQAQERENDQVLEAIASETSSEINKIKRVLLRLNNDDYGRCHYCGEQIAPARLEALPETDACINCAQLH